MRTSLLLVGAATVSLAGLAGVWAQDRSPGDGPLPLTPQSVASDRGLEDKGMSLECTVVDMYSYLSGKGGPATGAKHAQASIGVRPESPLEGHSSAQLLLLIFDPEKSAAVIAYNAASKQVGKRTKLLGRVLTRDGVTAFEVIGLDSQTQNP